MRKMNAVVVGLVMLGFTSAALSKEDSDGSVDLGPNHDVLSKLDCNACHVCDSPTRGMPCLRSCPRPGGGKPNVEVLPEDYILLNTFPWETRRFLPLWFSHGTHAKMAGMGDKGKCVVCHHHSEPGKPFPPCSDCHKVEPASGELSMPGLKAAYHRQCMGCHRDWSHGTKCVVCHKPKGNAITPPPKPTTMDIVGHVPIKSPERKIYKTDLDDGPVVTFHHEYHIKQYDLNCENCHRGEQCVYCHDEMKAAGSVTKGRHDTCEACHDLDKCSMCHKSSPEAKPTPFSHEKRTGYALSKPHAKLNCRACHKIVPYGKLQKNCTACHKDWDADSFDHSVTGQVLDENHAEADCTDCHKDGAYDKSPTCSECHDEDVKFPDKRPGPTK